MLMRVRGGHLAATRWHLARITLSFADPANAFFASGSDSRNMYLTMKPTLVASLKSSFQSIGFSFVT